MNLMQIAALSLGLIATENFVLVRIPGADPFFGTTSRIKTAAFSGIGVMLAMLAGAAAAWPFGRLLARLELFHLQTLVFMVVIAGISALFNWFLSKMSSALRAELGIHPRNIAVNGAVMGIALINAGMGTGFFPSLGGALAAGVSFAVTAILFASVRERVSLTANCPKSMDGLPLALVTAGLLVLVFMGFQGFGAAG